MQACISGRKLQACGKCGKRLSEMNTVRKMTGVDLKSCLHSMTQEMSELVAFREKDEVEFYSDWRSVIRLERLAANIDMIFSARTDQRLKDIQSTLAQKPEQKKQMYPKLVHLRQSFPEGTSFEEAHAVARRIRKIGMVEDSRQFVYVFEQTGETPEDLGKNFHMHVRFYVKGKTTDVSKGKVAKEIVRITKWPKNSTHVVFHDNVHKLTSYMAGNKSFAEHPNKKAKCDMDVIWRHQNRLHKEYLLRNAHGA